MPLSAIHKAAKWKKYGKEGEQARNEGAPQTYLVVHADPETRGGYDPSKFNPPDELVTGCGKPIGALYASKYYPDKNGGHASDWDRYTGDSIPRMRNSHGYTFQLTPEARVRTINNDDDYSEFYEMYYNDDGEIDWNKVRLDHDAVRFGDKFARTSGNEAHTEDYKYPVPYLNAGQLLVFNPDVVTNAKEWRRNEDLHPGDWYPEWMRNSPELLKWEMESRKGYGAYHNNTYTGPEQPTADKDGLDEAWGYRDIPGVADYYTSTKEGMRTNGRDKAV